MTHGLAASEASAQGAHSSQKQTRATVSAAPVICWACLRYLKTLPLREACHKLFTPECLELFLRGTSGRVASTGKLW